MPVMDMAALHLSEELPQGCGRRGYGIDIANIHSTASKYLNHILPIVR